MLRCVYVAALLTVYARAAEPMPMGTLSGMVVDPDGRPVAGAKISTETFDPNTSTRRVMAEARTDAGGRFHLGPVDPFYRQLRFGLLVEAKGFAGQCIPSGNRSVFPGLDCDLGTIRLDHGRVFTGTVIDVAGAPLADAAVTAQSYWLQLGHTVGGAVIDKLKTDAKGRFRTLPLPVGQLLLAVRVPDRQVAHVSSRPITPGGEEDLGEIHLEKDVPVTGVVRYEDGTPIAGAKIGGTVGHDATTDTHGAFTLRGFGPNPSFQMNVSKEGCATRRQSERYR